MSAPPSDTGGLRAVASPVEALVPCSQELDAAQLRQPKKTYHQKSAKKKRTDSKLGIQEGDS